MTAVTKMRADDVAPRRARMLTGGKWVDGASGKVLEVEDPAHRRPIAEVPRGHAEDVARAVQAAASAFPAWSRTIPRERGRLLARIADALEARVEELARTIALETGNALRTQARPEAKITVDVIRYFGGLGGELKGETIPLGEHVLSYTRREPLGVVGAIIPWNAPVLLAALKIGPALCAGNTLVLKAAEDAPLGVLMLAEVCQDFLPPGVLNVLTGLGEKCGAPLANHPMISKLSFTGSTEVGKLIMRAASDRVVPDVARTWREEPLDCLPRCERGLGHRWNYCGHALHPAEPVSRRSSSAIRSMRQATGGGGLPPRSCRPSA